MITDKPSAPRTDLKYAIHLIMTGQKDPAFAARVQAETEQITEDIRRKHGILNIAVDLIRECATNHEIRPGQQHRVKWVLTEADSDKAQRLRTANRVSEPGSRVVRS